jgi:hypothetical protein
VLGATLTTLDSTGGARSALGGGGALVAFVVLPLLAPVAVPRDASGP